MTNVTQTGIDETSIDSANPRPAAPRYHSFGWGAALGVAAAFLYSLANIGLRDLSTKVDFVLVAAIKAACTAAVSWPWLIAIWIRRRFVVPPWYTLLILIIAAVQVQVFGGVMMQRAFGIIGLALVVPIYIGSMVAWTAVLGKLFLNEKVNVPLIIALSVLIGSVFLLTLGADQAHDKLQSEENLVMKGSSVWEGIAAAITVGLSFAILGIAIRGTLRTTDIPEQTPVVVVATVGTIGLGLWSISRGGLQDLSTTETQNLVSMIFAGICNAVGFVCLARALKILPAIYVIAINASQAAIAGMLGVILFSEPLSSALIWGLLTMLLAFVLLAGSRAKPCKDE